MSKKYRIRPTAPDVWVVEKKGWIFWHSFITYIDECFRYEHPQEFHSVEDAKLAMLKQIKENRQFAEREATRKEKIKKHLSTPTFYY